MTIAFAILGVFQPHCSAGILRETVTRSVAGATGDGCTVTVLFYPKNAQQTSHFGIRIRYGCA